MKRNDIENLVGESLEDMGLVEHVKELECRGCGECESSVDNTGLCEGCRIKQYNSDNFQEDFD